MHKNTVRGWIRGGLPTIDARRPTLITGSDLRRFLEAKSKKRKQPCAPREIYCVRCRAPKAPAESIADYIPITSNSGNLRGLCPDCGTLIHRRVSYAKLDDFRTVLDVALPQALPSKSDRRRGGRRAILKLEGHRENRDAQTNPDRFGEIQKTKGKSEP